MKKLCGLLLTSLILLYACQKEVSFENGEGISSEGTLQSDLTGDCLPKEVSGTYEADVALVGTANTIDVQVNVLKTGPYLIYTDTVNGYYFRGSGSFSATGLNSVTLQGTGKPLLDGIDNFTVRYGASECIIPVTVLPAGSGGPAEFTFNGGPGTCMDFAVTGDYVVAVPLVSGTNSVVIKVNVTTAGTYNISTAESNGMTFSGTGTLLTGAQTITLNGTGTPVTAGITPIPLTAGSSTCSFSINVLAVPPPEKNYHPTTPGSNWSYEADYDLTAPDLPGDTLLYRSNGSVNVSGVPYNVLEITDNASSGFDTDAAYHKSGGDYFRHTDLAYWIGLDASQVVEYIFLKDDQPINTSWTTAAYTGTVTDNGVTVPVIVRMKFTIVQKDVDVTYNLANGPVTRSNTIVVEERYEQQISGTWQTGTSFAKHYYARGIGLVLDEYFDGSSGQPDFRQSLRRYQIAP